uniref:Ig-like domain-containing protein n=1 Tax=Sander lucioperca TaxID=283035 RepID=A0A8C9WWM8_SANLU
FSIALLNVRTKAVNVSFFLSFNLSNPFSGLKVTMTPSAVVTEGQRVTLSCSTSCPLTDNTNYIWYFNSRPLTPTEKQNKHLVLDPVRSQHAGNYSCAVETPHNISSSEENLTVKREVNIKTNLQNTIVYFTFFLLFLKYVALVTHISHQSLSSSDSSSNTECSKTDSYITTCCISPLPEDEVKYAIHIFVLSFPVFLLALI